MAGRAAGVTGVDGARVQSMPLPILYSINYNKDPPVKDIKFKYYN